MWLRASFQSTHPIPKTCQCCCWGLRAVDCDEPWDGFDVDGARWLSRTIEAKRVSIDADRWSRRTSFRPRDP
jgi:hypothetical protein